MTKGNELLLDYVGRQLAIYFPDDIDSRLVLKKNIEEAHERLMYSMSKVKLRGYSQFNYLHSDLYAQFLYFLSNSVWKNSQDAGVASKLFYLNKVMHGINCMYDTNMPDIFLLIHCVGTVLGKAEYSDYFVACQNVTVGSDRGKMPKMKEGVYMGPGSSIVGNCSVGENVHMAINSSVLNIHIPNAMLVVGVGNGDNYRPIRRNLIDEQYFIP